MFQQVSRLRGNSFKLPSKLAPTTLSTHDIHTKIAIVGGGTAGATCAGQIARSGMAHTNEITVFDPSKHHWYQPGLTMVSGGILGNTDNDILSVENGLLHKPMQSVFSPNINFISDKITEYSPNNNSIYTSKGDKYTYDYLIVCNGIELRYDLIEGLSEALDDPMVPVGSMYRLDYAKKINKLRNNLKEGVAICTMPKMPIKCAGAPIKFLNLADWSWRENGVRSDINVHYYTTLPAMFGVKKYSDALTQLINQRSIKPHYNHELIKVDGLNQIAYFRDANNNDASAVTTTVSFDLLHAPPPQRPNEFISNSELADNAGYIDVNKETLQSTKYENIFSLGDCSNVPTAKTAAAVYAQAPVLLHNMQLIMNGSCKGANNKQLNAKYDGYTSCPIFTGNKKLILAEFKYGGVPKESFPVDQGQPRTFTYYLKRYFFPFVYWNFGPKGLWYGSSAFFQPKWPKMVSKASPAVSDVTEKKVEQKVEKVETGTTQAKTA